MRLLSVLCALWFALMAGFFFAFSTTTMPALAQVSPQSGLLAMQAINETVSNPGFAAGFWVAIVLAVIGLFAAILRRPAGWRYLMAGCLIYIVGAFMVTAVGNVPLNQALARVEPMLPSGLQAWAAYQRDWLALNHIRLFAAMMAGLVVLWPLVSDSARR